MSARVVIPSQSQAGGSAEGTVTIPNLVWVMTHNLGFMPAAFRFWNLSEDEELEPESIEYLSDNATMAVWPEPTTGKWLTS